MSMYVDDQPHFIYLVDEYDPSHLFFKLLHVNTHLVFLAVTIRSHDSSQFVAGSFRYLQLPYAFMHTSGHPPNNLDTPESSLTASRGTWR